MAQPVSSRKDADDNRIYSWGNEHFFSVTTILKAMPKHALVPWAAKCVAEYAMENMEHIRTEIEQGRKADILKFMKKAPDRERDSAADRGTAVHEACEAYILNGSFPALGDERIGPSIIQFQRFLREWQPEYEHIEATIYNRKRKYAGTLDAIVRLKITESLLAQLAPYGWDKLIGSAGGRFMLDIKTGKGVYSEVGLQTSAYRYGEFIGLDGVEKPVPETEPIALVLHLRPQGYKIIPARADEEVFKSFLYATQNFKWQNDISKTILGKPLEADLGSQLEGSLALLEEAKLAGVTPQTLLQQVA